MRLCFVYTKMHLFFKNLLQRAIKSHRFYKGSAAALEQAEFLESLRKEKEKPENVDEDSTDTSKLTLKDFRKICIQCPLGRFLPFIFTFSDTTCEKVSFHFLHGSDAKLFKLYHRDSKLC